MCILSHISSTHIHIIIHFSTNIFTLAKLSIQCMMCVFHVCHVYHHIWISVDLEIMQKYSTHKTLQLNSTRCTSNVRNLLNLYTKHHDIKVNSVHPRTGEFLLVLVPLPKPSATTVVDCSSDDSEEVVTKIGINRVIKISGSLALKPY